MITWLSDFTRFLIGRTDHPIYRREMAGWSYSGAWRQLRGGCVPLVGLLFLVTIGCCGAVGGLTILPEIQLPEDWFVIVFIVVAALFIGEGVLRFVTGLIATALGATVISAELEAQTFGLLRLTMVTPSDIVLAKFGAAFRQIRLPLLLILLVRLLIVLIGAISLVIVIIQGINTAGSSGISPSDLLSSPVLPVTGLMVVEYGIALGFAFIAFLAWIAFFIFQPILDMLLYVALGVFASSWAKTRANGLITAGAFRVGLWMLSYVSGQIFSTGLSLLTLPLMALPALPTWIQDAASSPGLLILLAALAAILMLITSISIELSISLGLLRATTARAEHLPSLG